MAKSTEIVAGSEGIGRKYSDNQQRSTVSDCKE